MKSLDKVNVLVNPKISGDQLLSFYERNNACEVGEGKEGATRVLQHSSLIIGAFEGDKLVGIARAMFDGSAGAIMEFSIDLEYQGQDLKFRNGTTIEKDSSGLGKKMGRILIEELFRMGTTFIEYYILQKCDEEFFESVGFKHNKGLLPYFIDIRPYSRGLVPEWGWEAHSARCSS